MAIEIRLNILDAPLPIRTHSHGDEGILMVANIVGRVTKSGLSLDIYTFHEINATSTNAKGHIPLQLQHIRLIMARVVT